MVDYGIGGKVAIVTGGSQGLGRAVALAFAAEGANVVICARRQELLDETAEELKAAGAPDALGVSADMLVPEDIERVVATTAERFGRVDMLVNNAVTFPLHATGTLPEDSAWELHLDVKFLASVRTSRAVLPHMQRNGWGRIVNIGGLAARTVFNGPSTAGAANAALANFSKGLATMVAKDGVTVNCIHPGALRATRHEMNMAHAMEEFGITREEAERRAVERVPIGRLIPPEEMAQTVLYLCSMHAGAVTGQSIAVDGGGAPGVNY